MTTPWTAAHPVDATLAAALVHRDFPELRDRAPVHLGSGWDNDVWAFGDLAFRFPRRPEGVSLLELELRVLPALAPLLPLPIPEPGYVGTPDPAFPYPWYGHRRLAGRSAEHADPEHLGSLAEPLGTFLRALHAAEVPSVPDDTYKSFPELRLAKTMERLPGLERTRWASVRDRIERRLRAPLPPPPAWRTCHGDLYIRHLLVDDTGLTGIIDWGDVRRGNPGMDLSVAVAVLPPEARDAFWTAYGERDEALEAWAAFYALHYGVLLTAYAAAIGDTTLLAAGERALTATLGPLVP
ncbi:MAG: phosphotransferase [Alphaproteobacteria bacterium]|nr:phosphotransferase [Alphaproteobacteria bacterium]MCB9694541.1 phosphotransferase [Alphaproteobacteria bacterium]